MFRRMRGKACARMGPPRFDCTSWAQFFLIFFCFFPENTSSPEPAVTAVIPATGNPEHMGGTISKPASARLPDPQQPPEDPPALGCAVGRRGLMTASRGTENAEQHKRPDKDLSSTSTSRRNARFSLEAPVEPGADQPSGSANRRHDQHKTYGHALEGEEARETAVDDQGQGPAIARLKPLKHGAFACRCPSRRQRAPQGSVSARSGRRSRPSHRREKPISPPSATLPARGDPRQFAGKTNSIAGQ